jgi:hypothetical protein
MVVTMHFFGKRERERERLERTFSSPFYFTNAFAMKTTYESSLSLCSWRAKCVFSFYHTLILLNKI